MRLFVTGDTHGNHDISKLNSKNWTERKQLTRDDLLIICGDFGLLWCDEPDGEEQWWLKWLDDFQCQVAFLDGNHENFNRLEKLPVEQYYGGKVGRVSENVVHLHRGEIFNFDGTTAFVMGGGLSIDKQFRTENLSWWPQEIPSQTEMDYARENLESINYSADIILTHTAPVSIINVMAMQNRDTILSSDKLSDPTAMFLEEIFKLSFKKFRKWYFGHFHIDWDFHYFRALYQDVEEVQLGNHVYEQ